jgi:AcrR family transcriptional regulator
MSKLLVIDIESAFTRAVSGESVRKIANSLRVTEGALRYHFRKGASPKEVRRLAFELFYANRRLSMLNESEQRLVDRLVQKGRSKSNVAT